MHIVVVVNLDTIRERAVRTRTTPAEGAASKPYENLLTLERGLGRGAKGQKPKVVDQILGPRASPWAGRRPTVQIPRARPFPNSNTTIQRRFLTYYTGVFNTWFLGRPKIVDLGSLGGHGGPETPFKRWGAKRPTFPKGFAGRRGRQKSTMFGRSKNHASKTRVWRRSDLEAQNPKFVFLPVGLALPDPPE